ncbi:MAG: DUF3300 domain-containing protein, partial [Gammaproteobacteria bacterium]|nr:DUF3300 domain-containing protein [Gammaproteobacteria bacterium]
VPEPYDAAELQQLVGPIALYVDDLIGIVLPASAYPLQVVEAVRFLDAQQENPALVPDASWDDAVVALLNYPEVLRMMSDNLRWTANLGDAFVYQQPELLDAIQQFRSLAQSSGHLQSDEYQVVDNADGAIQIAPADPQIIYVPYYVPTEVVSYYSAPAIRYYPYGYPVYDYPYSAGYSFRSGFFWGVTTAYIVSWNTRYVYAYPHGYARHPYYGRQYWQRHYVRHSYYDRTRDHDHVWRPNARRNTRPQHYDDNRGRDWHRGGQTAPTRGNASTFVPAVTSSLTTSTRNARNPHREENWNSRATDRGGRGFERTDIERRGVRPPPRRTSAAPSTARTRIPVKGLREAPHAQPQEQSEPESAPSRDAPRQQQAMRGARGRADGRMTKEP